VRHFARLATHLRQRGVAMPAHFGKEAGSLASDSATRHAGTDEDIRFQPLRIDGVFAVREERHD
jgi:hypothetical protein